MQTKNAFEVKADLPGVEKKDIKVNVDGDVLTISHERAEKKEDKKDENGVKYHVSCLSSVLKGTLFLTASMPVHRACRPARGSPDCPIVCLELLGAIFQECPTLSCTVVPLPRRQCLDHSFIRLQRLSASPAGCNLVRILPVHRNACLTVCNMCAEGGEVLSIRAAPRATA